MTTNESVVYKSYINGMLTIHNVPYTPFTYGVGADGEKDFLKSSVLHKLLTMQQHMMQHNILEMNYDDF